MHMLAINRPTATINTRRFKKVKPNQSFAIVIEETAPCAVDSDHQASAGAAAALAFPFARALVAGVFFDTCLQVFQAKSVSSLLLFICSSIQALGAAYDSASSFLLATAAEATVYCSSSRVARALSLSLISLANVYAPSF